MRAVGAMMWKEQRNEVKAISWKPGETSDSFALEKATVADGKGTGNGWRSLTAVAAVLAIRNLPARGWPRVRALHHRTRLAESST